MLSDIFFVKSVIQEHFKQRYVYIHKTYFECDEHFVRYINNTHICTSCILKHENITIYMSSCKSITEKITMFQPYKVSLLNMMLHIMPSYILLIDVYTNLKLDNFNDYSITDIETQIVRSYSTYSFNLSKNMIHTLAVHMNHMYNRDPLCDLDFNMLSILIYMKLQDVLHSIDTIKDTTIFMLSLIESNKIY